MELARVGKCARADLLPSHLGLRPETGCQRYVAHAPFSTKSLFLPTAGSWQMVALSRVSKCHKGCHQAKMVHPTWGQPHPMASLGVMGYEGGAEGPSSSRGPCDGRRPVSRPNHSSAPPFAKSGFLHSFPSSTL